MTCQAPEAGNRVRAAAVTWAMRTSILIALVAGLLATGCGDRVVADGHHSQDAVTVPSPLVRRLSADARRAIRANGGGPVSREQAVVSTHRAAAQLLFGAKQVVTDDRPVYVIQLVGRFIGYSASWPAGGHAPTGSVMVIVVDAKTMQTVDWGLDRRPQQLSKLGTPFDLVA